MIIEKPFIGKIDLWDNVCAIQTKNTLTMIVWGFTNTSHKNEWNISEKALEVCKQRILTDYKYYKESLISK